MNQQFKNWIDVTQLQNTASKNDDKKRKNEFFSSREILNIDVLKFQAFLKLILKIFKKKKWTGDEKRSSVLNLGNFTDKCDRK